MKLDFSTPTKKEFKLDDDKENTTASEMQPPPTKRLKAKRCLFGASDPGRVRDLLQQELDSILKVSFSLFDGERPCYRLITKFCFQPCERFIVEGYTQCQGPIRQKPKPKIDTSKKASNWGHTQKAKKDLKIILPFNFLL